MLIMFLDFRLDCPELSDLLFSRIFLTSRDAGRTLMTKLAWRCNVAQLFPAYFSHTRVYIVD